MFSDMRDKIKFYILQVLILGSAGFFAWVSYGWLRYGFGWYSDTPLAYVLALILIGLFILVVCLPVQIICKNFGNSLAAYILGLLSGSIGVLVFVELFTKRPLTAKYFLQDLWLYHAILGVLGIWFCFNFRRKFKVCVPDGTGQTSA